MLRYGAPRSPPATELSPNEDFWFGDVFGAIAKPVAGRIVSRRRIDPGNPLLLKSLAESGEVVFEKREGEIAEAFARAFADRYPAMRSSLRAQREALALLRDVQAERVVEMMRDLQIRHHHMAVVQRMNAEFSRPA